MSNRKFLNILFSLFMVASLVLGGSVQVQGVMAMPVDPTDESNVPHYFGPYPNWANSPFTLPDAEVSLTVAEGCSGSGAAAEATVGGGGAITGITVTSTGNNYEAAGRCAPEVVITGSGTGAAAKATVTKFGAVIGVTIDTPGSGYNSPRVEFIGGGGVDAAGTAYGGVDAVHLSDPGAGYTMPTVDFDLPDSPDGVQAKAHAVWDEATGVIQGIVVDHPGSGYSFAPHVVIRNGTIFAPLPLMEGGHLATATTTLMVTSVVMDVFGSGYNNPPSVIITDYKGNGSGATATAIIDAGAVTAITLSSPGSGYITPGGIRKFVDTLPGLGPANANNLGQYIPVAVPDTTTYPGSDYYVIELGEYTEKMHSDLPETTLRGYRQANMGGTPFHYMGPAIITEKDRPVRILFRNTLPAGVGGDLFMPADSTIMGSGPGPMEMMEPMDEGSVMDAVRNPACSEYPKPDSCFADNRATLHLHGGNSPWISDGTPHQWITPANESTPWPEGVSVVDVPDMTTPGPGEMTFFYTNQQSARLMFYHDHAWGITRLNVYAGEAAPYIITDDTEKALVNSGTIPGADQTIPLVIQDKTFVPQAEQMAWQDPTWDYSRWGDYGDLWYHHVYMPAQNPGSPGGMSSFGRWMYSPWFWPPQDARYGPIANPYYDPSCDLDDPATWQYDEEPWCEPAMIPGTPLISAGMEQFNDTPVVNGTAYPTVTLDPGSYRFRILNAANDRFWNLQWYVADETGTEVALNAAEVAAAQLDPVVFPTPDLTKSPAGPDWIQIGNESGFLPAPVVVDGQQVTTWIEDPTRFDAGLVDQHSLLLAPAERADVVVDFSKFSGKTLILYNDAPAAFPARIPSYDYYTGAPDLRPVGAPQILPGYGPNTRTIMQVKISNGSAKTFDLMKLQSAFKHKADGSGVFESGQPPIIVGQAAYNSAYGSSFVSSGWCNAPSNPSSKCDGYARISEQGGDMFKFDTLLKSQVSVRIEPKAIQDETSESSFDEFGRMSALLGLEVVPATPGAANTVLIPYTYPLVDVFDTSSLPTADVKVTPISSGDDGTQIWKITHNGVDTHPIHFHAADVQVLNRVTWDNIIKPPHPTELGWKETIRVSPLEDTYVAIRPILPVLPFDFPNSVRLLSPMMPEGAWLANTTLAEQLSLPLLGFAPDGEPIDIKNHYINYGAEYVYHCHILSHEEMDMMHAVTFAFRPVAPSGLAFDASTLTLSWVDNSLSETAFAVEKSTDGGVSWAEVGRIDRPLLDANTTGEVLNFAVSAWSEGDQYRVAALNTVGDTWDYSDPNLNEIAPGTFAFPVITTESLSEVLDTTPPPAPQPPAAPSDLTATQAGLQVSLAWMDNANNETGFVIERATDGVNFAVLATVGADTTSYVDADVSTGVSYDYRVAAVNNAGPSAYSNTASVTVVEVSPPPAAPSDLEANFEDGPQIELVWVDNSADETGFVIERATDGVSFSILATVGAGTTGYVDTAVSGGITYTYRVAAVNDGGTSAYSNTASATVPADVTVPAAPSNLTATGVTQTSLTLNWQDNSANEDGFTIQRATNTGFTKNLATVNVGPDVTSYADSGLKKNTKYYYRVQAYNIAGASPWSPTLNVTTAK